jgi:hypothetical protein
MRAAKTDDGKWSPINVRVDDLGDKTACHTTARDVEKVLFASSKAKEKGRRTRHLGVVGHKLAVLQKPELLIDEVQHLRHLREVSFC